MTLARSRLAWEQVTLERVDDFQRARIISAMIEVSSEVGYIKAAVAPIIARAGVSRRTFYELFDGREDCFLAAFDWGVAQARIAMARAYASQRSWRNRVRHALAALLMLLDSEPELARVCVIEALGAGELVLTRRRQLADELAAVLEADAPHAREGHGTRALLTAEVVIGGAFSVIHNRLFEDGRRAAGEEHTSVAISAEDGARPLILLHGHLMALIALSYLGPRAAGEELTRAAPKISVGEIASAHAGTGGRRLLQRFDTRLTYRTVRCLMFLAEHPGSSNREIAKGAEVPDEGQASKLLARLVKLDMITNSRPAGPRLPNRWMLTAQGEQVVSAVRTLTIAIGEKNEPG